MPLYAAYGAALDPALMLERCPHSPLVGTGWLEGWRLTFGGADLGWHGPLVTVVEAATDRVFVALYDVHPFDEPVLDEWEGLRSGLYRRLHTRVATLDGDVTAWVYALDAYEGGQPHADYLNLLADAAGKAGAPDDYVTNLRNRPCTS